jgi:hypothetical protein
MQATAACKEIKVYVHSFLIPRYMDVVFYLHSPATLTEARKTPESSKYEDKSAHIGEGLGFFVLDVWIAA